MTVDKPHIDDLINLTRNRIDLVQTLARHGPQTPTEIGEQVGKDRTSVWNALDRLTSRNWVTKDVDTGRYRLTDKGLTVAGMLEEYLAEHHC